MPRLETGEETEADWLAAAALPEEQKARDFRLFTSQIDDLPAGDEAGGVARRLVQRGEDFVERERRPGLNGGGWQGRQNVDGGVCGEWGNLGMEDIVWSCVANAPSFRYAVALSVDLQLCLVGDRDSP